MSLPIVMEMKSKGDQKRNKLNYCGLKKTKIINRPQALLFFCAIVFSMAGARGKIKAIFLMKMIIQPIRFLFARLSGIVEFYFYCIMILLLSCDIISKAKSG